jgi:putative ATP-binding cassette transporter
MVAALPRYFAHAVTMGGMNQLSGAFASVNSSLSWFVFNYTSLQGFRVVVARLSGLDRAADPPPRTEPSITRTTTKDRALTVTGLALRTPAGRRLAERLSFSVGPGERWLLRGESGVGKSTLMRALAGIWPYGAGSIAVPEGATLLFLAQKNYMPPGTLKAALCYPSEESAFDEATCRQALIDCRLGGYMERLSEVARWGQRLSPGEQQRLAFARAMLHRPDYLFLDESTSALDTATERHLYEMLVERLPDTAILSISHRNTLDAIHSHKMDIVAAEAGPFAAPQTADIAKGESAVEPAPFPPLRAFS